MTDTPDLPYITALEIEGLRSFGTKQSFDFTAKSGVPAMWNVLLGENGTGKTTALLAILSAHEKFHLGVFIESILREENINVSVICANKKKGLQVKPKGLLVHHFANWTIWGYGALRRINDLRFTDNIQVAKHGYETLFDEGVGLQDPSEWLIRADYVAKTRGDARDNARLERVKDVLARVLPDVERAENIKIDVFDNQPGVRFVTPYGEVPSSGLSVGYRSMAAWVVDLAVRMVDRYPDSKDPLGEPAVVLVDEFDVHLHPSWQRQAINHLRSCFPRTQFIVTAHSPLIVQELPEDSTIHVLRREGGEVVVTRHPNEVRTWRVDQLLMSDLFDMDSARSSAVTAELERREVLLAKKRLTKKEREELEGLNARAEALPTEDTPKEMDDAEILRRAAELLRARGFGAVEPPASLMAKLYGEGTEGR
jgi:hypothetical protein